MEESGTSAFLLSSSLAGDDYSVQRHCMKMSSEESSNFSAMGVHIAGSTSDKEDVNTWSLVANVWKWCRDWPFSSYHCRDGFTFLSTLSPTSLKPQYWKLPWPWAPEHYLEYPGHSLDYQFLLLALLALPCLQMKNRHHYLLTHNFNWDKETDWLSGYQTRGCILVLHQMIRMSLAVNEKMLQGWTQQLHSIMM